MTLRKDREEGAPGPWRFVKNDSGSFILDGNGSAIMAETETGAWTPFDVDHRRIARVPDLEARVLSDAAVIAAADALAGLVQNEEDADGVSPAMREALAAYNAAKEAKG